MNYTFLNYIKALVSIPQIQQDSFSSLITNKSIKKGEKFIKEGQFSRSIAFVKNGLFRYYYKNLNGLEYTKGFVLENSVLVSYSAYLENRKSYLTIQALEDSTIEIVNLSKFQLLTLEHPCWNEFLVHVLQQVFLNKEEREREFLLFNVQQRYNSFLKKFPNLEERIKQHLIASYLGISPESLSRTRRKMGLLT